ncbi:MAG: type II toxin-antitoxin system mRNA interferase toxin, RelE/StbE family [Gammaproteobacteria bacterium]|nr:type II toxin-antitoxin system mRNA interferase toxin, RelE/StbE family [Gammaproteobacteria bacterium]MYD01324.1 type II toxin-antitoxin system mRNA interferase toxin, RelE/StbE family [Gammaproteobacteria bacterium]MYI24644.1 type II toxin-antitoxin system mRNA interferase toxin, RelE/StbE family [Gammaproteobacteria bacterium]
MNEYQIFETRQFRKDLRSITKADHKNIVSKLRRTVHPRLREHPHFGTHVRKLKGYEPETWRYRIGPWRFFYEIDDKAYIVSLITASHSGSAY